MKLKYKKADLVKLDEKAIKIYENAKIELKTLRDNAKATCLDYDPKDNYKNGHSPRFYQKRAIIFNTICEEFSRCGIKMF